MLTRHSIIAAQILFSSVLLAQDKINSTIPVLYLPQGYVFESLSSTGFYNAVNSHVANLGGGNPAALTDYRKLALGVAYQLETSPQPGWMSFEQSRVQNLYPQAAGLVVPFRAFRFGGGFSQRYNSLLDFGKLPETTPEQPDGTGNYIKSSKSEVLCCYSAIVTYSFQDCLAPGNMLSIGLTGGLNHLNLIENIGELRLHENFLTLSWTFGIHYNDGNKVFIGLTYLRAPEFDDSFIYEGERIRVKDKMPDKLHFGIGYRPHPAVNIAVDLVNVYWHQRTRASNPQTNYADIAGNLQVKLTQRLALTGGFLASGCRLSSYLTPFDNNIYGLYLLGGMNWRLRHFDLDLVYGDSTENSGAWRQQKIGKVAIGYYL